jgi:hypothetical protein
MACLSKEYNQFVKSENYILYKRFLTLYCINQKNKRDGLAAEVDILQLFQDCATAKEENLENEKLKSYAFYTDGGAYQDSNTYFLYRLHGDGSVLYSTIKIPDTKKHGVNI